MEGRTFRLNLVVVRRDPGDDGDDVLAPEMLRERTGEVGGDGVAVMDEEMVEQAVGAADVPARGRPSISRSCEDM